MKRAVLAVGLAAVLGVAGVAQTPAKGALKSDFVLVVTELDKTASKKLGVKPTDFKSGTGTVTRDEVIAALDQLFTKYQTKFRVTPRPYPVYADVIDQFNKTKASQESLRKLSRWGMIGPVSRLAAGKDQTVTEEDLGDWLGYFYTRVMVYTHQPDPAWTPDLQGG